MSNKITNKEVAELVKKYFGINSVIIKELGGYYDQNFYIKDDKNKEFVFKRSIRDKFETLDFQNKMMIHLKAKGLAVPKVIKSLNGEEITKTENSLIRLITFLPGKSVASDDYKEDLLKNVGKLSANSDIALADFEYPEPIRTDENVIVWNLKYASLLKKFLKNIDDKNEREILNKIIQDYENKVMPIENKFNAGISHSDENQYNIISEDGNNISGLIDFGDSCYTYYVNNLAIVIAHFMLRQNNPLEKASYIFKAYQEIFPLNKEEINVLPILIKTRLATMIIMAYNTLKDDPENNYIKEEIEPAWNILKILCMKSDQEIMEIFKR